MMGKRDFAAAADKAAKAADLLASRGFHGIHAESLAAHLGFLATPGAATVQRPAARRAALPTRGRTR